MTRDKGSWSGSRVLETKLFKRFGDAHDPASDPGPHPDTHRIQERPHIAAELMVVRLKTDRPECGLTPGEARHARTKSARPQAVIAAKP
jgi:hypothetical protein